MYFWGHSRYSYDEKFAGSAAKLRSLVHDWSRHIGVQPACRLAFREAVSHMSVLCRFRSSFAF